MTSRRFFLQRAAAALGTLLAGRELSHGVIITPLPKVYAPKRVVVIGAGLSGLAAAYELHRAGHTVVVLEARNRPGGRVWTLRDGFSAGQYAEAGGESFYPVPENYAARYAEEFGLARAESGPAGLSAVWHFGGQTFGAQGAIRLPVLSADEQEIGVNGIRQKYLNPAVEELARLLDPANGSWSEDAIRRFDSTSFATLLRSRGASPAAIELLRILDSDFVGEGAEQYSAIAMIGHAYNVRAASRFLQGAFFSLQGGNDCLPAEIARRLGESVRYNALVTQVEQNSTGTTVRYTTNRQMESVSADFVVCTIPFSALAATTFVPSLPREKVAAIQGLSYASVARTYIQCRERFWHSQGLSGRASTDLPTTYFWESTAGQPGPRGIMQGYLMGEHARAFVRLDDVARRNFALEQARSVFPDITPTLKRFSLSPGTKTRTAGEHTRTSNQGMRQTSLPDSRHPKAAFILQGSIRRRGSYRHPCKVR